MAHRGGVSSPTSQTAIDNAAFSVIDSTDVIVVVDSIHIADSSSGNLIAFRGRYRLPEVIDIQDALAGTVAASIHVIEICIDLIDRAISHDR